MNSRQKRDLIVVLKLAAFVAFVLVIFGLAVWFSNQGNAY